MAIQLKGGYRKRLKDLEVYLDGVLPSWIPRNMENVDFAMAALLTVASSADANITVLKNGTLLGFVESTAPNGNLSKASLYMVESAKMASYFISQIGFIPGISLDQVVQASAFTVLGYGLYKASKILVENEKIPHGDLLSRIPSYAFLLACTYYRFKCASSWI
jgi:hypothetical protein